MSVHAPGRVILGGVRRTAKTGLGRAIARALPSSAPLAGGRRSITAGLSMTSMIDVLVVMTVFLLLTFSANDHSHARDLSSLPPAHNTSDLLDAPVVDVRADGVSVDGRVVATQGELSAFSSRGQVTRLEGLAALLRSKHDLSMQLQPGREPPTHVILAIDGDVPAALVKSVVMTAARSGYPSIDFMVQPAPKG
jgi:biopolymer transport protein ExbD